MIFAFKTIDEAKDFVHGLETILDKYHVVTVTDTFTVAGYEKNLGSYCKGWRNLDNVTITTAYLANAVAVMLPDPEDFTKKSDKKTPTDNINHPAHYKTKSGLETIDVIEAFTDGLNGVEATDTGNVIKYICRWSHKNGIEDLKKAQWYLNHLINHVEKESK